MGLSRLSHGRTAARRLPQCSAGSLLPELITASADGAGAVGSGAERADRTDLDGPRSASTARRWWQAARAAADSSGDGRCPELVRAREAISGLAERRPLAELLATRRRRLAAGAVRGRAGARRPGAGPGRARTHSGQAHRALQELIGVGDEFLRRHAARRLGRTSCTGAEGRVCTSLRVRRCRLRPAGPRRELCPESWLGERARLDLGLAECLVVAGRSQPGLAPALRVLVELPDEWHDLLTCTTPPTGCCTSYTQSPVQ